MEAEDPCAIPSSAATRSRTAGYFASCRQPFLQEKYGRRRGFSGGAIAFDKMLTLVIVVVVVVARLVVMAVAVVYQKRCKQKTLDTEHLGAKGP